MNVSPKKLLKYALFYLNENNQLILPDKNIDFKNEKLYTIFPKITVYKLYSQLFNEWLTVHSSFSTICKRNNDYFFITSKYNDLWIYYNFCKQEWEDCFTIKEDVNLDFEKNLFDILDLVKPDLNKEIPRTYKENKEKWYRANCKKKLNKNRNLY